MVDIEVKKNITRMRGKEKQTKPGLLPMAASAPLWIRTGMNSGSMIGLKEMKS